MRPYIEVIVAVSHRSGCGIKERGCFIVSGFIKEYGRGRRSITYT